MKTDYKVGELIYDANIYDGLNTFLSDLQFYKNGFRRTKMLEYLNYAVARVGLLFQLHKMDIVFVA